MTSAHLLRCAHVPERLWQRIVRLPALRSLVLDGHEFDDERLKQLQQVRSLEELIVYKPAATREAVDAFEKARPDVSLRIEMFWPQFWPDGAIPCDPRTWPKDWGPAVVPQSARRWAGRVVRVAGGWFTIVNQGAGTIDLYLTQCDQYRTLHVQPWNTVTIHFRVPDDVRRLKDQRPWFFFDGVLSVPEMDSSGPATYSLSDAAIVHREPFD